MPTLESLPFDQTLTSEQFDQLRELLRQVAQEMGALLLTEEDLPTPLTFCPATLATEHFTLVAAEPFSTLLCGNLEQAAPESAVPASDHRLLYRVSLSFDPDTIATFLDGLTPAVPTSWRSTLVQARSVLRPNNPQVQSQFTLRLIGQLTGSMPSSSSTDTLLRQQVQQERLLNQVTTQIRQSLELPVILQTAVEQVRQVLRVDRLVIYCLDLENSPAVPWEETPPASTASNRNGSVIYEARASEATPSVLNVSEAHCFVSTSSPDEWRERNLAIAVPDVEIKYAVAPCLLQFLRQSQVRAKLVAPIWIRDRLWGLLIAHQCTQPRQWQDKEQRFLQQIAEHLGIAISQAQLYAELQQQKYTLEQRVATRTQELQDVMQAAQAANRAKSEFLASVSHELRTPLTCIIGMSATLQRWTHDSLNDRQRNFLQTIHDSGEYLLTLINDILDLSQVEAGKMLLTVSEFSLSRLSQQTLKAFEGQAALREIILELDSRVTPQSDRFVADSRRVQQILFNLLDNAIKFTPTGGKVTLRVLAEENLAVFQVKDGGIGIPESQLPLLFEKFRQLNAGYQRQYRGTGLGLALTKQLVELHGGWIDVESTVGVGSIFTVRLPRQSIDDPAQVPKTRRLTIPSLVRGRVVLIEHQEELANLICDILTAAGYQIIWMIEGASAIEQVEVLQPVVVLTDIHLPDIDGYTLIQQLRKNPATKQLKVIALTSTLSDPELDRWRTAGADDCLAKPIRPDRLLQTVMALTDQ
jgi:two-component system sensor histidine kinase/response regulator